MTRYGPLTHFDGNYYASTSEARGDVELSLRAAEIWQALGFTYTPTAFEGVKVTEPRAGGRRHVTLYARDLFTGLPLICELDPDTGKPINLESFL